MDPYIRARLLVASRPPARSAALVPAAACGVLAAATQRRACSRSSRAKRSTRVVAGPQMPAAERTRLTDQVRRIYKDQNYQLIWIDGDRPSSRYRQFAKALDAADDHGLPAELYTMPIARSVRATAQRFPPNRRRSSTSKSTAAFLRYFTHLTGGRLDPRALQSLWTLKPEKPDLVAALTGRGEKQRPRRSDGTLCSRSILNIASFRRRSCVIARSRRKADGRRFRQYAAQAAPAIGRSCRRCGSGWRSKAISIRRTKKIRVRFSTTPSSTR